MTVLDRSPAVTPNVAAGLLLAALSLGASLGLDLPLPSVAAILETTGATRSRAYEQRKALMELLPTLHRPPGRPRVEPEPAADSRVAELRGEALRLLMGKPGCVQLSSRRAHYSETFRVFVLALRERHADMPLSQLADALCIPLGTLEDWLRPGRVPPTEPPVSTAPALELDALEPNAKQVEIETVLGAWSAWHGSFTRFCEHVRRDHRVSLGNSLIASILFEHGVRTPRRRRGRSRDEEALRGTFETFFAGAQWVGDGKRLEVMVDGQALHQNLELVVDAHTDAAVGIDVRDEEDSQAVVAAFGAGVETTGERPLALLLDNKPCNHTEAVDGALGETKRLRATPVRPQNKAHVEGAFGLFAQAVPPIVLSTSDPHQLANAVALLVATVFFRVLNCRPRRDRGGMTRTQLYDQQVTPQQREAALASLTERMRKQQLAQQTRAARVDPVVRGLLDDAFGRLGLIDPEHHFRDAIACYPLDAVVDALAIFDGKRVAGTLPDGVDARYLLGIVRNLHHVHEAEPITAALLRERLAARDRLLLPLVHERDAILVDTAANTGAIIDASIARLTRAERAIDRQFWLDTIANAFPADDDQRVPLARRAARRLHAAFHIAPRQRQALERSLMRRLWPLC